jgi:hypothetical protein
MSETTTRAGAGPDTQRVCLPSPAILPDDSAMVVDIDQPDDAPGFCSSGRTGSYQMMMRSSFDRLRAVRR